ncbi:MAG TPA: zf-HC2 domain-containing protein [Terriglobales bacterium]|nr:zf-HC2 domain-containing protein [Terriglobales bacterium]
MNCHEISERLPELAAGMDTSMPEAEQREVKKHIASCEACATHLGDLQKTMALLDEWQAPEPSPYFDTRMQARLREEMARPRAAWFSWLHRPAWATSLAAVLFVGALTLGVSNKSYFVETGAISTNPPSLGLPVEPGTAVGDLQALEKNDELYADFDVLDDLQVQDDVTANP